MTGPDFSYQRAKKEHTGEARTFTIDAETFTLAPVLGTVALEGFARSQKGDVSGVFDALRGLVGAEGYDRLIALDLDSDELVAVLEGIINLYGEAGKSSASSTSLNGDGASLSPTS